MATNMRTPYRPPDIDRAKVVNKMPEHQRGAVLLPTTPVVLINRGPHVLEDKFDGHDYVFEPFGYFEVTYAAALHLQKRAIVQGTKAIDASRPSYVSWIGILGIDSDEACQPFTPEQVKALGESTEAFFRDPSDPLQRGMTTVRTADIIPTLPGHGLATPAQAFAAGEGAGGSVALRQEVVGGTDESRAAATERLTGSDATREEASARGSGYEPPDVTELRVRSDDPIAFRGDAPPDEGGREPVGAAAGAPKAPAIGRKKAR